MNNRLPMNGIASLGDAVASVSQQELEQLVDDDLAPEQRRRVVAALAEQPDGWRRCALAFLEAQSFGRACRRFAAESGGALNGIALKNKESQLAEGNQPQMFGEPVLESAPPRRGANRRQHEVRRVAASLVAVAAVLTAAFIVGLALGRASSWSKSSPEIAAERTSGGSIVGGNVVMPDTVRNGPPGAPSAPSVAGGAPAKRERLVLHVLGFVNMDGEDGARRAVPILAAPGLKIEPPPRPEPTWTGDRRSGASADSPLPANLVPAKLGSANRVMLDPSAIELVHAIHAPPVR